MLKGKIIHDGPSVASGSHDYYVKVGSVTVDITDDVRALVAQAVTRSVAQKEQELAKQRAAHADTLDRYNQIQRIVLAGGAGMPTG